MRKFSSGLAPILIVVVLGILTMIVFFIPQVTKPSKFSGGQEVSCKDLDFGSDGSLGITFLQDYCIGNICSRYETKEECESVDVVEITDAKTLSAEGKDGINDCIWVATMNTEKCTPRY